MHILHENLTWLSGIAKKAPNHSMYKCAHVHIHKFKYMAESSVGKCMCKKLTDELLTTQRSWLTFCCIPVSAKCNDSITMMKFSFI
jgi:hypothetical protein